MPKRNRLPKEYISVTEASKLLGCGPEQIKRALRNRTFPVGVAFYGGLYEYDGKWSYRIPRQEFYKMFRPDLLEGSES